MVSGKLKDYTITTLKSDLKNNKDEVALYSYIKRKHKLAEKNNRYVVRMKLDGENGGIVSVLIPKGVIDNNLLDKNSYVDCCSTTCHLEVAGVSVYYDRASNLSTQIHDKK